MGKSNPKLLQNREGRTQSLKPYLLTISPGGYFVDEIINSWQEEKPVQGRFSQVSKGRRVTYPGLLRRCP